MSLSQIAELAGDFTKKTERIFYRDSGETMTMLPRSPSEIAELAGDLTKKMERIFNHGSGETMSP